MARRRGYGEGSITKRADGRWHGRVDLGREHGQRVQHSVYGRTRREVAKKVRTLQTAVEEGRVVPDERQRVSTFLAQWLNVKHQQLRPRAYATYESAVRRVIEPGLGHLVLSKLRPTHVAAWLDEQRQKGATPRTLRYARTVLRAALNQALRWQLVASNAAALVDAPRHTARAIAPLTPKQARGLLTAAADHPLGALVSVGVGLGLRLGEALGLRWQDVDLDAATVSVVQALERSGGDAAQRRRLTQERRRLLADRKVATDVETRQALDVALGKVRQQLAAVKTTVVFVAPKTARSRRTISVPAVVVKALKAQRVRQLEQRLTAGRAWQETGLVFTTPIGTPLDHSNVTRAFKTMLVSAKLPATTRYHDLRHTAASLLLAQGVDVRTIMETLGHSQISLTLNTYTHVAPTLQKAAAAQLDAVLTRSGRE